MAINMKVTNAAYSIGEAIGNKEKYLTAKENYYKILEEELLKQPFNGWVDLENPEDALIESIYNWDNKEWVQEILDDYLRFCSIYSKCTKKDILNKELVMDAKNYLAK